MSLENQEQWNKDRLLRSVEFFPEELSKWCKRRGLAATVPPEWPSKGSIVISRGPQRVEIKMIDPNGWDSFMKLNRIWGLLLECANGSKTVVGRWQESWRTWNHAKVEWTDIDFGQFMEEQLSEYFGVEAKAARSPQ